MIHIHNLIINPARFEVLVDNNPIELTATEFHILLEFIRQTLSGRQISEREIILHEEEDRFLQAHGTILSDYEKKIVGVLVVLSDITRLKRMVRSPCHIGK